MTQNEIKEQMDKKLIELEECAFHDNFVLNTRMCELRKEIAELRSKCKHKYENGYCIYCKEKEITK